ncbi:MAG: LytS/YhcK type 5TM receptor domain-containing protein [Carboxydocellales bacterium]
MLFSVHINKTTILDFRMMAIILSALYGGSFASIFTGLLIGIFRIVSTTQLVNVLIPYWVGTSLMSLFLYFYTERLNAYNLLFHNFKTDASIDFLTGLNNVRQFDLIINRAMLNAKENQEMKKADNALYKAKHSGRNKVETA